MASSNISTSRRGTANASRLRFIELESKDSVIRYWANKALHVLDNPKLSTTARIVIVKDIQARIADRLHEISAAAPKKQLHAPIAIAKPAELGCPKQIARMKASFKQLAVPSLFVEKVPVAKVKLGPRVSKNI